LYKTHSHEIPEPRDRTAQQGVEMTKARYSDNSAVNALLEEFLKKFPNPTSADWKDLIDRHQEVETELAEASIAFRRARVEAFESDIEREAQDIYEGTISFALNKVFQEPGPVLNQAQTKVSAILGSKAKEVAQEIGLGPYGPLLTGVLSGRTLAPSRVLRALSAKLDLSIAALTEHFRRTFTARQLASYKAIDGKPQVKINPSSWEDAVTSLKLSSEETARLLEFDDKRSIK
jgi:hypothetical protein